ncbi:zincin-like metallopeptidase domain-containing protein [Glaciimonas sp. GG7]
METATFIEQVAKLFADRLAAGTALWQRDVRGVLQSMPIAMTEDQDVPLSGGNAMLLAQTMADRGWTDPRFFTEDNLASMGAAVIEGVAGTTIQFAKSVGTDGLVLSAPEVKAYRLYNAAEVIGLPEWKAPRRDWPLETLGTRLLPKFEIDIVHDQVDQAFYSREDGKVHMPPMRSFPSVSDYIGVAVHELSHGSASELQRSVTGVAGTPSYAREEMRAEMASMQLSVALGLPHNIARHAGFVEEWRNILHAEPGEFFRATRDAEKMAALVLWHVKSVEKEVAVEKSRTTTPDRVAQSKKKSGTTRGQYLARLRYLFDHRQTILAVPFRQKDDAMAAGALYFGIENLWFAPPDADITKLKAWDPRQSSLAAPQMPSKSTMIASIQDKMRALGLTITDRVQREMQEAMNGEWHYAPVEAKSSNRSGAYVLYLDGRAGNASGNSTPYAVIMNHKSGAKDTWFYDGPELTPEQLARMRADAQARDAQLAKEVAVTQGSVSLQANALWNRASHITDPTTHGYLEAKGIEAHGAKMAQGDILLEYPAFSNTEGKSIIRPHQSYLLRPLRDLEGKLWSLQAISDDGKIKTFMAGGKKKGLFDLIGADTLPEKGALAFAEGFATSASLRESSGWVIANCFDAGNLEAVIAEIGSNIPKAVTPVIGADNDQFFVERAFEMLLQTGIVAGPSLDGATSGEIQVRSAFDATRRIVLGEAIADGQSYQGPKGRYKLSFENDVSTLNIVNKAILEIAINDSSGEQKIKTLRTGNRGAEAAAAALVKLPRALIVTPKFASLTGRPTDWNDLAKREGIDQLRSQLIEQGAGFLLGKSRSPDSTQKREVSTGHSR